MAKRRPRFFGALGSETEKEINKLAKDKISFDLLHVKALKR